ncbi:MAG TPA: cation-translocating P-type ATPase [Ferruginibacter sp.]|nr:cation-translocating P-type ATPase [Ferruginibacter sp.]
MEKVDWTVEGMTCTNCALTVSKFLESKGMSEVKVNPIDGSVSFLPKADADLKKLASGIQGLGYSVISADKTAPQQKRFLKNNKERFLFTLPFTLVLMLHMLEGRLHIHWLMNPWLQLALCLPVFITGMWFFGRSAWKSLQNGVPNMNVLIAMGSLAAFVYSLTGALLNLGEDYLFFETTATIICLVFLGHYLEDVSVQSTQRAVHALARSQKVMANMIAFDDQHQEQVFPIENTQLRTGDLVLIKTGEQVPADCKILWGDALVDESIITGESLPVSKQKKDLLIGGSVLQQGTVKAQVTATGTDTVLSGILRMVQQAQSEKPPLQKLADRISAVFVPVVVGIALLTFLINYFGFQVAAGESLMRAIAVLVISCPCAMGLATPAAIAVGLGRAARKGILFRNAGSLESFRNIRQVVFDKTGTLTNGQFSISDFNADMDEDGFKKIAFSLEKYSNHPIAQAITREWKRNDLVHWATVEEIRGLGVRATDKEGNVYMAGSARILDASYTGPAHNVFISKNGNLLGWIDAKDSIRPEAKEVVAWLHKKNIQTVLLSGDREEKCWDVANAVGIKQVFAEQTPEQKLKKISELNQASPTAMIGDGINDAPALAKATLGISLSEASQIAMQSADVILMNHGLRNLPEALGLGEHTYITIRQNLFWAFAYNVVAIPIASIGLLKPSLAALSMGLSDVVLAINSVRLFVKKVF